MYSLPQSYNQTSKCKRCICSNAYHVCICFVALKVYKELERLLKLSGCPYSVDETLKIAETIVTIEIARPENKDTITKTLCLTEEERTIAYLIDTDDWLEL